MSVVAPLQSWWRRRRKPLPVAELKQICHQQEPATISIEVTTDQLDRPCGVLMAGTMLPPEWWDE